MDVNMVYGIFEFRGSTNTVRYCNCSFSNITVTGGNNASALCGYFNNENDIFIELCSFYKCNGLFPMFWGYTCHNVIINSIFNFESLYKILIIIL
jgi:hypothetical protein